MWRDNREIEHTPVNRRLRPNSSPKIFVAETDPLNPTNDPTEYLKVIALMCGENLFYILEYI